MKFWDYHRWFQNNPIYKDWLHVIKQDGNINIIYQPFARFYGRAWQEGDPVSEWDREKREIRVFTDAPGDETVHAARAAYEVTNAYQDGRYDIDNPYDIQKDGKFAHRAMMRLGIDRMAWPEGLDIFK